MMLLRRVFGPLVLVAAALSLVRCADAPLATSEHLPLRWGGDAEGGAPFVEADPAAPERLRGFDVEIAGMIARGLRREPRFVQVAWSSIEASVERGDFDVGMSGVEDRAELRARHAVTIPYFEFREVLAVRTADSARYRTLADLAGRRVATPQHGNTQDIAARHYLAANLAQKDLANVLPIANAEQAGMMSRGQIDAAWTPEPWGARLVAENGATIVAEEKDLWPGRQFALAVVVTTPEFLRDHPDVVAKVLAVHHHWTQRLVADPKACLPQLGSALFALTGKKLPPGVLDSAITRVTFTDDPLPDTFKTMGQWTYDLGFEQRPARLDTLFDVSVLKQVQNPPAQPGGRS